MEQDFEDFGVAVANALKKNEELETLVDKVRKEHKKSTNKKEEEHEILRKVGVHRYT